MGRRRRKRMRRINSLSRYIPPQVSVDVYVCTGKASKLSTFSEGQASLRRRNFVRQTDADVCRRMLTDADVFR
jgi:hypothetical protein